MRDCKQIQTSWHIKKATNKKHLIIVRHYIQRMRVHNKWSLKLFHLEILSQTSNQTPSAGQFYIWTSLFLYTPVLIINVVLAVQMFNMSSPIIYFLTKLATSPLICLSEEANKEQEELQLRGLSNLFLFESIIFFFHMYSALSRPLFLCLRLCMKRLLFALNRKHVCWVRVSWSKTAFTISSWSVLQKEYPESSSVHCAVMALDVRGEQSICGCILDHIVDHSELTVCRWTGKGIKQSIRFGDVIFKW